MTHQGGRRRCNTNGAIPDFKGPHTDTPPARAARAYSRGPARMHERKGGSLFGPTYRISTRPRVSDSSPSRTFDA